MPHMGHVHRVKSRRAMTSGSVTVSRVGPGRFPLLALKLEQDLQRV